MSERVTVKDVRGVFAVYAKLVDDHNLLRGPVFRLVLEEGSPGAGRAWRIYEQSDDTGGLFCPAVGGDFLGATVKEAYDNLHARLSTLTDAIHILTEEGQS